MPTPAPTPARAATIIDQPAAPTVVAVPAATGANLAIVGTIWPLLVNRIYRIYNLSANISSDTSRAVLFDDASIFLEFYADVEGNTSIAVIPLVEQKCANAILGPAGVSLSDSGDPLVAFRAGLLIVGVTNGTAAAFQVIAEADVFNSDAVNPHNASIGYAMLFDDYAA
jgi:hypothetical protein